MDVSNTTFTVAPAGRYRLSYAVNTTLGVAISTRLLINGTPNVASTVSGVASLSNFSNEIIFDLPVNSTVQLQVLGAAVGLTLVTGAGATLMITRLS